MRAPPARCDVPLRGCSAPPWLDVLPETAVRVHGVLCASFRWVHVHAALACSPLVGWAGALRGARRRAVVMRASPAAAMPRS